MEPSQLAVASSRARIALGVAAIAAPALLGRLAVGGTGSGPGTKLFARMLGGRDVALGLGVVIAIDRGAPVRGWLEACALADAVDAGAAVLSRNEISRNAFVGTVGLAAGASIVNVWLSRQLDPAPDAEPGHPEAIATGHPPGRASA